MNKKIILLVSILLVILFSSQIFAYETKGEIPHLANTNKGGIFNLQIEDVEFVKYIQPLKIPSVGDKLYCGHIELKTSVLSGNSKDLALSILMAIPFTDKSIYPKYIEEIYLSGYEGKNQFISRQNKKIWMYSPSSNSRTHKMYLYDEELCSAKTLDFYIFKPYYPLVAKTTKMGLFTSLSVIIPALNLVNIFDFTSDSVFEDYQEKVYVHHYKRGVFNHKYVISAFDLEKDAAKLYNINNTENYSDGSAYFYNADYAYGIPETNKNVKKENNTVDTVEKEDDTVDTVEKEKETEKETITLKQEQLKINKIINKENNEELVYDIENNRYYFVSDNLNADVYLDSAYNQNKEICYLFTDLSNLNQENINSFVINHLKGETVTELSNVTCTNNVNSGKISLENISENKFLLVLQRKDLENLLVSKTRIIKISKEAYLNFVRYEINKKIATFFCPNCNYPKFNFDLSTTEQNIIIPEITVDIEESNENIVDSETSTQEQTDDSTNTCSIYKQNSLDEYISCLKNNLNVFDITKIYDYGGSSGTGSELMNIKYNDSSNCYNNSEFNNLIFNTAQKLNLTEEETAQLWARIAAESGCSVTCGAGSNCGSDGVAQIMVSVWTEEYNRLKSKLLDINPSKYSTETKYKTELENSRTDQETSLEISTAINRMNLANVINSSKNSTKPITTEMYTTYDHNSAINVKFISAYLYCSPNYSFFSGGLNQVYKNEGCAYTAFHKMGYYLGYKKMIYDCSKEEISNSFVDAYKNKYQGKYCK